MYRKFLILLLFSCCASAGATVRRVPDMYASIGDALAAADPGDVVSVACGNYLESGLVLPQGVSLQSDGGADCAIIDAQGVGQLLSADGITGASLEGFTLRGGNGVFGGALGAVDSEISIHNVRFEANQASLGGALHARNSQLSLFDCAIDDNVAAEDAGFQISGGTVSFEDCVIANNGPAIGGGGGVFAAVASFTRCRFENNVSVESGGGLEIWTNAQVEFDECSFLGNSAAWGGAVYLHFGVLSSTLSRCELRDNSASGDGGGVYVGQDSELTLSGGVVLDNASPSGPQGYVGAGGIVHLNCVETPVEQWSGSGTIDVDPGNCPVATRALSFGELKALISPR